MKDPIEVHVPVVESAIINGWRYEYAVSGYHLKDFLLKMILLHRAGRTENAFDYIQMLTDKIPDDGVQQ